MAGRNSDRVAIIDLDSILYSAAHGKKIPLKNGDYERDSEGRLVYIDKTKPEIAGSIDAMMNSILLETDSNKYIAYVKGENTAAHRYAARPDYKSNRPNEPPSWWEFAKNYVIKNWSAVPVDTIEVDDAVNITRLNISNSYIIAIDKDLLLLQGKHYNWRTQEWVETSLDEEINNFWSDMIIGQPGDGISGLPGKGKAYARALVRDHGILSPLVIMKEYGKSYDSPVQATYEFDSNFTCLKILDRYDGFVIPDPIDYINESVEDGETESLFDSL